MVCDDEAFARLVGDGELYDYELGEKYVVAPAPGGDHAVLQGRIIAALALSMGDCEVAGPTNLGVLGQPGQRWYVVPDVAILPADWRGDVDASLHAVVAVEVRSPREDMAGKLADYRAVANRTGLVVGEVWYVDGDVVVVHPLASSESGATAYPQALDAVRATVRAWWERSTRR